MTQEDKELLLKDLCARLPYGVKCNVQDGKINKDYVLTDIHTNGYGFDNKYGVFYGSNSFIVKPYLRPMSSMTEEERQEYNHIYQCRCHEKSAIRLTTLCYSHHLDINGLIEKGLAIAVTKVNNPYK